MPSNETAGRRSSLLSYHIASGSTAQAFPEVSDRRILGEMSDGFPFGHPVVLPKAVRWRNACRYLGVTM